jgi:hypothetical protein
MIQLKYRAPSITTWREILKYLPPTPCAIYYRAELMDLSHTCRLLSSAGLDCSSQKSSQTRSMRTRSQVIKLIPGVYKRALAALSFDDLFVFTLEKNQLAAFLGAWANFWCMAVNMYCMVL